MNAYQVLGEDYVRSSTYGLSGDTLAKKRAELKTEAQMKIAPLKEGLSPKVYDGFVADGYTADQMLDYMAYEKDKREKEAKAKAEAAYAKDVSFAKDAFTKEYDGTGFKDRLDRGVGRTLTELNVLGHKAVGAKPSAESIGFLQADDEIASDFEKANRTPEQQKIYKEKEKAFEEAKGVVDTTGTLFSMLYEKLKNPKEWDMAGLVGGEVVNPANYVSAGVGSLVTKGLANTALSTGTKVGVSATAGAATDLGVGSAYEYNLVKAKGGSDEDAEKAAIAAAATNVAMGAGSGALGSTSRILRKVKESKEDVPTTPPDSDPSNPNAPTMLKTSDELRAEMGLPQELEESALLKVQKAYDDSDARSAKVLEIEAAKLDPVTREKTLRDVAPASLEEQTVSAIVNDGQPVSHRMAGNELAKKLEMTILHSKESMDAVRAKLRSEGVRGANLEKAVEAYVRKDIGIYEDFAAKKLRDSMRKANDVNGRNTGGDTAGEVNRSDNSVDGARATTEQNTQPTDIQKLSREYTQAQQDAGLDAGRGGTKDGLPQGVEQMGGQPTDGVDVTGVSRGGRDDLVPNENGVFIKPTLTELKADIAKVESRGSYTAKNPNSTAYGKYQFLKSTYDEASKALGKSVEELRTPQGQELAMEWLVAKNAKELEAKDIDATAFNVYGAHQQGVTGFERILKGKATEQDIVNMYNNTPKEYRTGKVRDDWMNYWQSKFPQDGKKSVDVVDVPSKDIADVADAVDVALEDVRFKNVDDTALTPTDAVDGLTDAETPVQKYERLRGDYETSHTEKLKLKADAEAYSTGLLGESAGVQKVHPNGFEIKTYPKRVEALQKIIDSKENKQSITVEVPIDSVEIAKVLKFRGDTPIKRVINRSDLIHVFKEHGDAKIEAARNQVAITMDDVANYPEIANSYDARIIIREKGGKGKVISAKQINGHYITIEEVSTRKNTLKLKTMYNTKGELKADTLDSKIGDSSLLSTSKNVQEVHQGERISESRDKSIAQKNIDVKNEAELVGQMDTKEALDLVQGDEYVRGVDGAEFRDVARGLDEAVGGDSKSYEAKMTEINTMSKKLKEAKRNGDSAAVRALEEEINTKKTKADYDEALRKLKEEC